jgi:hypothetical protein
LAFPVGLAAPDRVRRTCWTVLLEALKVLLHRSERRVISIRIDVVTKAFCLSAFTTRRGPSPFLHHA